MRTFKYIRKQEFDHDPNEVIDNFYTLDTILDKFVVKAPAGYIVFDSAAEYLDFYNATPEHERQFHEVIFNGPQKLRFDLDAKAASVLAWVDPVSDILDDIAAEFGLVSAATIGETRFDKIISGVLNAILDTFMFIYGVEVPAENVIICKSVAASDTPVEKYSCHIILDKYYVSGAPQAAEFYRQTVRALTLPYHEFVDGAVYKTTQNFRLAGCSKGDGRVKRIATGHDIARTFIRNTSECVLLKDIVGTEAPKDIITSKMPREDIEEVLKLCAADPSFRAHRFHFSRNNQLYFSRLESSYCSFCCKDHDRDNTAGVTVTYSGGVGTAYKFCRKSHTPGVELGQFAAVEPVHHDPAAAATVTTREGVIRHVIDKLAGRVRPKMLFDSLPVPQKHIYDDEKLRPFELTGTLVVHAAMKMGKTKALQEYVERHFSSKVTPQVVRVLSFRQTFSSNIKEKFPEFTLYSDVKGPIDHPKVIIQVESLHRLAIRPGMEPPDLVIMDECESIFEQFNSGLLRGNFNDCFAKFQYLVKYARHLICLDALISDRTYRILRQMRPGFEDTVVYHRNEHRNATDDTYYVCGNKAKWLSYLYESVSQDLKISVPISSLTEAKALARDLSRKFPAKTVRIYSSETRASDKREHFANVHTYWADCDVLIYTPTISAGVSFELKHFDRVFGFFTDQSCPAETCIQMLGRVRDVATREYYICIQASGGKLPDDEESVKKLLYDRRTNLLSEYEIGGLQMSYTATGHVQYSGDYFQMWVENTCIRNKSANSFARRLITQVADFGPRVLFLSDAMYEADFDAPLETDGVLNEAAAALVGDIKAAKSTISAEECDRIAAARELEPGEVEQIRADIGAQRDIPADVYDAYEKYRMRRDYGYRGDIDSKFVATFKQRAVRKIYRNLARVVGKDTEVAWRAIMAEEQATHEYKFADDEVSMQSDINRGYEADTHRYTLSLLRLFGWMRIDVKKVRHRDRILAEFDAEAEKLYWANIGAACAIVKVRPPSKPEVLGLRGEPGKYLAALLKPVNTMLQRMYGVKLVAAYKSDDMITLQPNNMFADSEAASETKKVPWLRPAD